MPRSIFGWDLPPGCSVRDIPGNGPEPPCALCGHFCTCEECPECSVVGCLEHAPLNMLQEKWTVADNQLRELERELNRREELMKQTCSTCGTEYKPDLKTGDPLWCDRCNEYV